MPTTIQANSYIMPINQPLTLSDSLKTPANNNFSFIRLLASLLVLVSHSSEFFPGIKDPLFTLTHFTTASFTGVCSFFFLSGILVSESLRHSPSYRNFLWRRFLRLYPAVWLLILLTALILGPILTTLPLKYYFSDPAFYRFLADSLLLRIQFFLPGVWTTAPTGPDLTGPLWSIVLEIKLYLLLFVFSLLKFPGKKLLLLTALSLIILFNLFFFPQAGALLSTAFSGILSISNPNVYTLLAPLFGAGIACHLYREKIRIKSSFIFIVLALLILSLLTHNIAIYSFFAIPASILYFGTRGVSITRKITPPADLSYSFYIFGLPVGKLVYIYLHPSSPFTCLLLTLACLLPIALLSWYLVEKPALSLKNRLS